MAWPASAAASPSAAPTCSQKLEALRPERDAHHRLCRSQRQPPSIPNSFPTRKKIIGDIRNDTFSWLAEEQLQVHPLAVELLHDRHRPQRQARSSPPCRRRMSSSAVPGPIWPNTVRVTVGSADGHGEAFKVAFKKVMDAPPATAELHNPFEHKRPSRPRITQPSTQRSVILRKPCHS